MTSPHPSAALLSTANESLAPVLPILNAFAHRHRNQHHSSHWWSSFSLVRRAARNLSTDLTSRPRSIKNKNKPGNVEGDNHPALARAKWMIRHVVPRTYMQVHTVLSAGLAIYYAPGRSDLIMRL
ncbi:hypothetical protein NCS55_00858900 [Fusarium keratoplasticum]|nr:hypothetical protein NCS55_00858900 [Fusarium keratoplasticum]